VEDRGVPVESYEVEESEWADREVAPAAHRGIDVVAAGDALLEEAHRVVEIREQEVVDDETGLVLHDDR
jgi:hypothetical protein